MNRELRKFIFDFYLGCIQICLLFTLNNPSAHCTVELFVVGDIL